MENVRVDKAKLLATLRTNRADHRAKFLEAQETFRDIVIKNLDAYRLRCEEVLEDRLEQARNGKVVTLAFAMPNIARIPEPEDYTSSYDRAIAMMEWEKADEIELSEFDFQRYVLNDWEWAQSFASNSLGYTAAGR